MLRNILIRTPMSHYLWRWREFLYKSMTSLAYSFEMSQSLKLWKIVRYISQRIGFSMVLRNEMIYDVFWRFEIFNILKLPMSKMSLRSLTSLMLARLSLLLISLDLPYGINCLEISMLFCKSVNNVSKGSITSKAKTLIWKRWNFNVVSFYHQQHQQQKQQQQQQQQKQQQCSKQKQHIHFRYQNQD